MYKSKSAKKVTATKNGTKRALSHQDKEKIRQKLMTRYEDLVNLMETPRRQKPVRHQSHERGNGRDRSHSRNGRSKGHHESKKINLDDSMRNQKGARSQTKLDRKHMSLSASFAGTPHHNSRPQTLKSPRDFLLRSADFTRKDSSSDRTWETDMGYATFSKQVSDHEAVDIHAGNGIRADYSYPKTLGSTYGKDFKPYSTFHPVTVYNPELHHREYRKNHHKMDMRTTNRSDFKAFKFAPVTSKTLTANSWFQKGGGDFVSRTTYNGEFPNWGVSTAVHEKRPHYPHREAELNFDSRTTYANAFTSKGKKVHREDRTKSVTFVANKDNQIYSKVHGHDMKTTKQSDFKGGSFDRVKHPSKKHKPENKRSITGPFIADQWTTESKKAYQHKKTRPVAPEKRGFTTYKLTFKHQKA